MFHGTKITFSISMRRLISEADGPRSVPGSRRSCRRVPPRSAKQREEKRRFPCPPYSQAKRAVSLPRHRPGPWPRLPLSCLRLQGGGTYPPEQGAAEDPGVHPQQKAARELGAVLPEINQRSLDEYDVLLYFSQNREQP